jgi:hypothetical protein
MPLLTIVITLVVVGILLWLVNTYLPMDGKIKKILNIVVVVVVILWLLNVFGVWNHLSNIHVSAPAGRDMNIGGIPNRGQAFLTLTILS